MSLTERQIELLDKVVREYVERARPVPSRLLSEKYDFGVCPATIRNEMFKLVEMNFLDQPHASAGRVPTDKAYRFFVDRMRRSDLVFSEMERLLERERKDLLRRMREASGLLAEESSLFAVTGFPERSLFFEEGWDKVLEMPEFEERHKTLGFAHLIKTFKKKVGLLGPEKEEVAVYIGSENPLTGESFEEFSLIVGRCRVNGKEKGVVSIMGPKRMPYKKNIGLLERIRKALEGS